jgi:hypothetical protein
MAYPAAKPVAMADLVGLTRPAGMADLAATVGRLGRLGRMGGTREISVVRCQLGYVMPM